MVLWAFISILQSVFLIDPLVCTCMAVGSAFRGSTLGAFLSNL